MDVHCKHCNKEVFVPLDLKQQMLRRLDIQLDMSYAEACADPNLTILLDSCFNCIEEGGYDGVLLRKKSIKKGDNYYDYHD